MVLYKNHHVQVKVVNLLSCRSDKWYPKDSRERIGIIVFLDEYINFEYEISPILLDENEIVNMYGTKWFGIESVIKVIPIFNNFEKYKKAILKELSTLGGLSHPNII